MEFLIITGLSGAGKSRAADVLEDLDYYCVDNMPVALLGRFAEFCIAAGGRYEKVALVTDVRENKDFSEFCVRQSCPAGSASSADSAWKKNYFA